MILLLEVLAVLAVVFGVAVVLTGRSEGLSEEGRDFADTGIPRDRAMTAQDVAGLRFALALRGYRMSEVDDALDRLAAELNARDEEIARLRGQEAHEVEQTPYVPSDATGDVPSGTPPLGDPLAAPWPAPPAPPEAEPEPEYVPSDATGEVVPGTEVDVLAAPDAEEPQPDTPEFVEPPATAPDPLTDPLPEVAAGSPFRPEVPDIPAYDPWSVTPRSRYTDGPTFVEVDHPEDDDVAEAVTEHHTGYAPSPEPADPAGEDDVRP